MVTKKDNCQQGPDGECAVIGKLGKTSLRIRAAIGIVLYLLGLITPQTASQLGLLS